MMLTMSRLLFTGRLTDKSIEKAAEKINEVIGNKPFTLVIVNDMHRPEIRPNQRLRLGTAKISRFQREATEEEDEAVQQYIMMDCDDLVMSLYANGFASAHRPVSLSVHAEQITAELYSPGGNHLWWCWVPERTES